jgi:hypothetical protein
LYSKEYLWAPNEQDIKRLLAVGKDRGFPGMLGLIDCMHWEWKNCPTAWHGVFQGKEKVRISFFQVKFCGSSCSLWSGVKIQVPTIVLEAVASYNLWIWHAWFQQWHLSLGRLPCF